MKFIFILCLLLVAQRDVLKHAMLAKTKRPYNPAELPAASRFRRNCQDLYADNQLSSARLQELLDDAHDAGVGGLRDVRSKTSSDWAKDNAHKRLRRKFLKRSQWPDLYWARIRTLNVKTGNEQYQWVAFLLPHELLEVLQRLSDGHALRDRRGLDPCSLAHLVHCETQANTELTPVGLWGDGAPCNWDRSESCENFSLNLPGQSGAYKSLRLPLTALLRSRISDHTWDDLMEVIAWSLQHAANGTWPRRRHDGSEFRTDKGDKTRLRKASRPGEPEKLGIRAALVEVRGDWKFFGECFKFPKWNTKRGCCWTCKCTPDQVLKILNALLN